MLASVTLKFTEHDDIVLPGNGITVFVGPNNSGKSLFLKELERAFASPSFPSNTFLLKDFAVKWLEAQEIDAELEKYELTDRQNDSVPIGHKVIGRIFPRGGVQVDVEQLKAVAKVGSAKYWWANTLLQWGVLRLDGRSRFDLTNDQNAGDLLVEPQNVLAHLFQDEVARAKVRELIKDAFGLTFAIDPTNLGQLRIRLSREEPLKDEQSLSADARTYYKKALHIKDASDGVQAFTGIVTSILSGEFHTILVDEPEAFLHPPLARKLGKNLAALATGRGGTLFASTHSSDFLMGCVQATKDVRVVRLEYTDGKSQGRKVDPGELEKLFRNPLMRSANAISGLFHDGVVVTESDNDRAFYAEIYYRLAATQDDYPSILFVNAQNKQTIKNIIDPLRKFGVPAAAIPDIDIIKDGGKTWQDWLAAGHLPKALHDSLGMQRGSIENLFKSAGKDMKAEGGINALQSSDKQAAEHLLGLLAEYGIFVVPHGEVEHWLKHLNVPGKKTDWTINMLERLGSDPADPDYIRPGTDDVWGFIKNVVGWIRNGARKGTS